MEDSLSQAVKPRTLADWCDWLCEREMPIFSGTVRRICAVAENAKAGASELAHIVMADPALVGKVLKLSNSVHYNPSRQPIGTLTRAVTLLGAKQINELALTASYIDAVQSSHNREMAHRYIVDALHSAVQAKAFAQLQKDPDPEEVYLAALLYNIGQVAFWCFAEEEGRLINHRLRMQPALSTETAEQDVLGFSLRSLGAALLKSWQLKGLILDAHQPKGSLTPRIRLVRTAYQLVQLRPTEAGTDEEALNAMLASLGKTYNKTPAAILELVRENARIADILSQQYAWEDEEEIEEEMEAAAEADAAAETTAEAEADEAAAAPAPAEREQQPAASAAKRRSASAQRLAWQDIQRDITAQLSGDFNLSLLFETVIEGMQRGIPMDRTLFALLDETRNVLKERSAVGWPSRKLRSRLEVPVAAFRQPSNIFMHALLGGSPVWINPDSDPQWERFYTPEIEAQFGRHECFIAPLAANGRVVGALYASRALSGLPLDQQAFDHFCLLAQQANFGLKLAQLPR